tara:strand:- start:665 stop:2482 length:1818 start_codon:yes stop_codon:yes gene_type:complete
MKKAQVIFIITNSNEENANKIRTSFDSLDNFSVNNIKSPDFSKIKDEEINDVLNKLPAGSIIAKTKFQSDEKVIICFPGFSSHIQVPVKQGEDIWYFEDESIYSSNDNNSFIKNYWLSRIYSFEEDVNFTHHERDFEKNKELNSKNVNKKEKKGSKSTRENRVINKKTKNGLSKPKFDQIESQKNSSNINLNIKKLIKENEESGFSFKPVPRFYNNIGSTTIQGSNNAIINLGTSLLQNNSNGAIDLVTGRLSLTDSVYKEFKRKTKSYEILTENNNKTNKKLTLEYNEKFPYYKIENELGYKEVLKDSTQYLVGKNELKISPKEFEKDIEADASRIYISESDNLDTNYITNKYLKYQSNIGLDDNKNEERVINTISNGNLSFDLDNSKNKLFISYDGLYPSVLIKTNHIRLYARKSIENTSINSSSIRIIKESSDYEKYSHICLEDNGNILIDGKKILIGNFKRAAFEQKLLKEEEIKDIVNNTKEESTFSSSFEKMSGNGETIILGHSELYSEPLVLGKSLVAMLTSLLESNIEVLRNVKDALNKVENHNHTSAAPGSPNAPMRSISMFSIDEHKKKVEEQIPVLEDLKNNIKKVLSKVSKSS